MYLINRFTGELVRVGDTVERTKANSKGNVPTAIVHSWNGSAGKVNLMFPDGNVVPTKPSRYGLVFGGDHG